MYVRIQVLMCMLYTVHSCTYEHKYVHVPDLYLLPEELFSVVESPEVLVLSEQLNGRL